MSDYTYLAHYQVKGAKHGVRRYQNPDGSLTPLGRVHYGVGEARKKVVGVTKKAVSSAGAAVKKAKKSTKDTFTSLKRQRKESKAIQKKRAFEAREARRAAKIERARRRLIEQESKKTLSELQREFEDTRNKQKIEYRRTRVDNLLKKQADVKLAADLREQERALKRDMKTLKKQATKDARKKYSKRAIANLSDAELSARIARLQNEIKLMGLEKERQSPTKTAAAKWIADVTAKGLSESGTKLVGAVGLKAGRELLDLSDKDIDEFLRITKKR